VGKIDKKQSDGVRFLIRHSKYSAILSKIHSFLTEIYQ